MKKNTNTPEPKQVAESWTIEYFNVSSGIIPTATIKLKSGEIIVRDAGTGANQISAAFKAIDRLTGTTGTLKSLSFRFALLDPKGEMLFTASVGLNFGDICSFHGRGNATDIVEAIAKAYLDAVNQFLASRNQGGEATASASTGI